MTAQIDLLIQECLDKVRIKEDNPHWCQYYTSMALQLGQLKALVTETSLKMIPLTKEPINNKKS